MDNHNWNRPSRSRYPHDEHIRRDSSRYNNEADERHRRRRGNDYGREKSMRRSLSPGPRTHHGDGYSYDVRRGGGSVEEGALRERDGETRHRDRSRRLSNDDKKHHSRHDRDRNSRSRSRSRSPSRTHHRRHRHHHRHRRASSTSRKVKVSKSAPAPVAPETLPFDARRLSRSAADYAAFRPLFARYLDLQKQIDIAALDEREARGRWKSFVNKWNMAQLAEGWYDPEVFRSAKLDYDEHMPAEFAARGGGDESNDDDMPVMRQDGGGGSHSGDEGDSYNGNKHGDDDDDYGPTLPGQIDPKTNDENNNNTNHKRHGPGIPSLSDLTLRREREAQERDEARSALRLERKADRALQKERLEDALPARADPGTAARRLEKRREVRDANARFANAKSDAVPELADADLLGEDADGRGGLEEYKRLKKEAERKKTEREVRREEILRAKREEREDRIREYKERESKTVDMLREIARARFGGL
ncbi:hypothetical protein F5Y17DRAFT_418643 [Xylariaceae sp. FL0594]|nr:hypothetical protein F5Y17DRAFT_418643 [Xylariaceae sp. FL0594]